MTQRFYVKSPYSGRWFRAPLQGVADGVDDAYPYPVGGGGSTEQEHLKTMVAMALENGKRLILREARPPSDA